MSRFRMHEVLGTRRCLGFTEKKMETTILSQGIYRGCYYNELYRVFLGVYGVVQVLGPS